MTTEDQEVVELLGAYVLDAVDDDEALRVERHLATCQHCREQTDSLRSVAAALSSDASLEGHDPPPAIWSGIEARVGAPRSSPLSDTTSASADANQHASSTVTRISDLGPRPWGTRWRWVATIAAALAVVALAAGLVNAQGRVDQLQSALSHPTRAAAIESALSSPGRQIVDLKSHGGAPVARLVVERNGTGFVVSSAMTALRPDQTYQLWAGIDGKAISLGLLGPRPAAGAAFSLATSLPAARELMVTVEPSGGVVAPDHAPIATARLHLD